MLSAAALLALLEVPLSASARVGSVSAKIFGVGGLLEKKMIADLEKSYEKSATFTNAFVAEKGIR